MSLNKSTSEDILLQIPSNIIVRIFPKTRLLNGSVLICMKYAFVETLFKILCLPTITVVEKYYHYHDD